MGVVVVACDVKHLLFTQLFVLLKKIKTFAIGRRREKAAGQKEGWTVSYLS